MPAKKAETVAIDLRRRLNDGEWKPGTMLPDERSLAGTYAVARNTIRKAFDALEAEGLIERHVGRGTFVSEKPAMQFAGILDHFLDASPIDILNLRIFIEPHSAEAAASHASSSELDAILEAEAKAAEVRDLDAYEAWDNEFHRRIYAAAHNRFLSDFFDLLSIIRYQAPMMEIRRRAFNEDMRLGYNQEHQQITEALRNWDGKAAGHAMRTHLLSRRRNYFGQ
ncbi:FadR/GntR family transcriptional regulator [Pseudohoeflea coraliihabitans]|uniref:GntR family transcriptional regulator n=1 Tax=Pseudohoeflea coraliihabitans TaxID=2860393 RepID=A0ABS6WNK4_9HYPH|nr:FCD domain-containing protein [Pseudohoeflea sp. DP4N28-3]MBW3097549.1 GntR family transcriptional regulator [Pseudohoeflea sp. DP4N28-3]